MSVHFILLLQDNMKKQSSILLSTAYLPPVEYLSRIFQADKIFIEVEETYQKQTYRNRCEICSANGKLALTIPVIKTFGNHSKTRDVKIDYSRKWQLEHWRAIVSAYNNSPFFLFYKDVFEPYYFSKFEYLLDFNTQFLNSILNLLKEEKIPDFTKTFVKETSGDLDDFRNKISPKNKTDLSLTPYYQVFSDRFGFLPNLSIVDLIFNNGPESLSVLTLVKFN
jgi:hypothetical protein